MTSIPAILRSGSDPLTMTWDFDNRLSSADVDNDAIDDVSYEFDALGRRVARDDGTTTTVFVQNGRQTIADYTSGTAATSPTYTYIYASYIDEPVMRGGTGGLRYYHRNQQYSVTALTNGSGGIEERYAYSAYGEPTITDGSGTVRATSAENNRYTYTGREWDEALELYHYRARMYDPVGGRFSGRDPIGFESGDTNIYRYVRSSPILLVDPSGLVSPSYDPRSPHHPIWPGGPIPANPTKPIFPDMPPPLGPDGEIDKLDGELGKFPRCSQCTSKELKSIMTKVRNAIAHTTPTDGTLDPCLRWCDGFADALKKQGGLGNKCVHSSGCTYAFDVNLTGGHVVFRIVLCNGQIIYVDNGTVGGDDNIGRPSDIPSVIFPFPLFPNNCLDDDNCADIPQTPLGDLPPADGGPLPR